MVCEQMVGIQCFQVVLPLRGLKALDTSADTPDGDFLHCLRAIHARVLREYRSAASGGREKSASPEVVLDVSSSDLELVRRSCSATLAADCLLTPTALPSAKVASSAAVATAKASAVERRALKTTKPGDICCSFCSTFSSLRVSTANLLINSLIARILSFVDFLLT